MPKIFISYSRRDRDFVERLRTDLQTCGADLWMDVQDIHTGDEWTEAVQEALQQCDLMILVISPAAMASRNVSDEWNYYLDENKPVVPVLHQPATIHFRLRRIQYSDFTNPAAYPAAFEALRGDLRRHGVKLAALTPVSTPTAPITPPAARPVSGRRYGIIGGAVVAVIAALVIIGLLLSGGDGDKDPGGISSPTQTESGVALLPSDTPAAEPSSTPESIATETAEPSATVEPAATDTPTEIPFTLTPTLNVSATVEAYYTTVALTQAWIDSRTATSMPTKTPTRQPTNTPRPAATSALRPTNPFLPASTPTLDSGYYSGGNSGWQVQTSSEFGLPMVLVPAGCFMMGSDNYSDDEKPAHQVCISRDYWIGLTEVTMAQYSGCVNAGRCTSPAQTLPNISSDAADHPVVYVNWNQTNTFAAWIGEGCALPTEAQWEYAARGPDSLEYPWGNHYAIGNQIPANTNAIDGWDEASPAGYFADGASWVGALDMAGNEWEWVSDLYGPYSAESQTDPLGPVGAYTERVMKGGSWYDGVDAARSSFRFVVGPMGTFSNWGFRVVCPAAQ